jgi:hypothetical protein
MTSRLERTEEVRSEVKQQWSEEWFATVILPNLTADDLNMSALDLTNVVFRWVEITRNPNTTLELVKKYINLPWNCSIISSNLIKSIDFIKENPDFPFLDWEYLSQNENISLKDIDDNPQFSWDYVSMSYRTDLTHDFVSKHNDKNWDYRVLSERENLWDDINENTQNYCVLQAIDNPRITLEFIERHMELYVEQASWFMRKIVGMKIVTLDFIEKHMDEIKYHSWIAANPNVTLDFMRKHKFDLKSWEIMRTFSELNPSITPELVRSNTDVFWHWDKLTIRKNFCPRENPEFPWDWRKYHENPNFNLEHVPEKRLMELNWHLVSCHKTLDIEQIIKYSKYIIWEVLTRNPHITMRFVADHPEFPWVYENLPMNHNCSLEILNRYKHESRTTQQHIIFTKSLVVETEAFIEREYKKHLAAYRIQQHWHLVRTDPNYALCRKKLERDFEYYESL